MRTIEKVWMPSFIARSQERNRSTFVDLELRRADLWENAKEKMRDALEALTAHSAARNQLGGPDGSDVAALVKAVCADTELHVEAQRDYQDATDDCKALGKLIGEIEAALKTGDCGHVKEVIADARRFDKAASAAYFNHVEG